MCKFVTQNEFKKLIIILNNMFTRIKIYCFIYQNYRQLLVWLGGKSFISKVGVNNKWERKKNPKKNNRLEFPEMTVIATGFLFYEIKSCLNGFL